MFPAFVNRDMLHTPTLQVQATVPLWRRTQLQDLLSTVFPLRNLFTHTHFSHSNHQEIGNEIKVQLQIQALPFHTKRNAKPVNPTQVVFPFPLWFLTIPLWCFCKISLFPGLLSDTLWFLFFYNLRVAVSPSWFRVFWDDPHPAYCELLMCEFLPNFLRT